MRHLIETDWAIQGMKYLATLGITVWVVSILLLLKVVDTTKLREFDPNQRLYLLSANGEFESGLTKLLQEVKGDISKTAIHFRNGDCFCETLVSTHSQELANTLTAANFHNITVNINDVAGITTYIPSTPALAIFNESQQLVYLGPYSTGLGCFTDNSLIDTIKQYLIAQYWGAQINTEAEGCYCAT